MVSRWRGASCLAEHELSRASSICQYIARPPRSAQVSARPFVTARMGGVGRVLLFPDLR